MLMEPRPRAERKKKGEVPTRLLMQSHQAFHQGLDIGEPGCYLPDVIQAEVDPQVPVGEVIRIFGIGGMDLVDQGYLIGGPSPIGNEGTEAGPDQRGDFVKVASIDVSAQDMLVCQRVILRRLTLRSLSCLLRL